MTLAAFRTWIVSTFFSNSTGNISGVELQQALLECANQLEAATTWTPIFGVVSDSQRRVLQVIDWINGVGTKPVVPAYVGATGYVATAALAVDIRGAAGATGASGTASASSLLQVTNFNPGVGVLAQLINSATIDGSNTGSMLDFTKAGYNEWRIGLAGGTADAFIIQGFAGATFPEFLRIDSTGKLGLGTTAPSEKLDVVGSGQFVGNLTAKHASNPALRVLLDQADNTVVNTIFGELQFIASVGLQKCASVRGFVSAFSDSVGLAFWTTFAGTYAESARITPDGRLGIGVTSPSEKLDIAGRIKTRGIVTNGSAPTIAVGAGLGTTGTTAAIVAGSNDMAGKMTLTTTAGVGVSAVMATVTFNVAYGSAPRAIILSPANAKAADERTRFYVSSITASGFVVSGASVSPSQPYSFDFQYVVIA
ncbi:hypothetical protein GCM10028808_73240 [Spirosoma migulaei]